MHTYIRYIRKNYPSQNHTVVFDGYFLMSTKAEEQKRRYRLKKSVYIIVICIKPEAFLSNPRSGHRLMALLMSGMQEKDISTHQSEQDADPLIVNASIDKSAFNPVALVGEDVDLAALLMTCTPSPRDVLMIKSGRGKAKTITLSSR
uniref:Uncharacterized protein n=1 Tax=Cacopsylla melanoneura TaxID=428564 RepID=A0A8D8RB40_9HEMI